MTGRACEKEFLIHVLLGTYAEKVFYFCLKKTGNVHEAEDLTSDILLSAIAALKKGVQPRHFSGWVWKIARNRYSVWADKKHKHSESESYIGELEIEDENTDLEKALVHDSELRLLRQELAFISSDYRDIVLAYYMRGRKIREIALDLGVPEGTVTSKLYRARKTLKEGMNMAREFGKRSYDPETISFIASGSQPSGLPWTAVERKLPVNILCEAHNNPCTIQELALELGIAAPYMEEEVDLLLKAELLKKLEGGKVLTSFFITPRECQNEINEIVCDFTERHAEEFWALAGNALEEAVKLGVPTGDYSREDARMFFALYLQQWIELSRFTKDIHTKFRRADGGNWGILGFEQGAVRRLPAAFFNNNGNDWGNLNWLGYQAMPGDGVFKDRRYRQDVPYALITLRLVAEGADPARLSEAEKESLRSLTEDGFCLIGAAGRPYVNALVFKGDMETRLQEALKALPDYTRLTEDMGRLTDAAKEIVARYANPYLKDDFEYYVAMSLANLRSTMARRWKDTGLYQGSSAQFCAFRY